MTLLSLVSFARFVDSVEYWLIDLVSHFPVQYAFLSLIMLVVFLRKRSVLPAVLSGFMMILNASVFIDTGKPVQAAMQPVSTFEVYSANIQRFNYDLGKLETELNSIDAEVVLLLEVTSAHEIHLQSLLKKFPFHSEFVPMGTLGISPVILSKFPILEYETTQLSSDGNALFVATLRVNEEEIMLYALHAANPSLKKFFASRNKQFLELAQEVRKQSRPVIVLGDFNATPYSPIFRRFLKISQLRDSRAGFGWQPSWPTVFPPAWIPIDHILVSSELQVHNRSTGARIGSDHFPVFTTLSIN